MIIMERLRFYLACTKPRIMEGTALPGIPQRIMILYDVNLYKKKQTRLIHNSNDNKTLSP